MTILVLTAADMCWWLGQINDTPDFIHVLLTQALLSANGVFGNRAARARRLFDHFEFGRAWCYLTSLQSIWTPHFLHPGPSLQQRLTFHRQEWRVKDVRLFERIASLLKWSDRDGKGFLWQWPSQNLGLQQRSSFVFFVLMCHLYSGIPFIVTCDTNDSQRCLIMDPTQHWNNKIYTTHYICICILRDDLNMLTLFTCTFTSIMHTPRTTHHYIQ